MNNNDVLRRLRYFLNYSDSKMQSVFLLGGVDVSQKDIKAYLHPEENPEFLICEHKQMACFLNGLITEKRGKKEGVEPRVETYLNNNIILNKLKIAFSLKSDDILDFLDLAGLPVSPHELSSFFRKSSHRNYKSCQDQILRNFLKGMQIKKDKPSTFWEKQASKKE